MKFKNLKMASIAEGWHYVDGQGTFALTDNPRLIAAHETPFIVYRMDGTSLAVIHDHELPEARLEQIAAARPGWLHAIISAERAHNPEPAGPTIHALIVAPTHADPTVCAFVAACSLVGEFKGQPDEFLVHVADHGSFEVTLDFDWNTQTWQGEVVAYEG
jgi:hypothetical protein